MKLACFAIMLICVFFAAHEMDARSYGNAFVWGAGALFNMLGYYRRPG